VGGCARSCGWPLPAWTIGDYLKGRTGGAWDALPRFEMGRSRFACAKCWGLRFDCFRSEPEEAWNRFVSVISGGLLYGREVPYPGKAEPGGEEVGAEEGAAVAID